MIRGIDHIVIAVPDLELAIQSLEQPAREIQRDDVNGTGVRFMIGPHVFDFVAPRGPGSPLADWLGAHGQSPYSAALRTPAGPARTLDPAQTLGAKLSLIAS